MEQYNRYNNIWICESRNDFEKIKEKISTDDLILCFDFGLRNQNCMLKLQIKYIDNFLSPLEALKYNIILKNYFSNWYYRKNSNENLLKYKNYNIGEAIKLNVYNDIVFTTHLALNILKLKKLSYKNIFINKKLEFTIKILNYLNFKFDIFEFEEQNTYQNYYFDIIKWMNEKINRTSIRNKTINYAFKLFDFLNFFLDKLTHSSKKYLYIQKYHPTRSLINFYRESKDYVIIVDSYTSFKNVFKERRVRYTKKISRSNNISLILNNFYLNEKNDLILEGINLAPLILKNIEADLESYLHDAINVIDSTEHYFNEKKLLLCVQVTDLWLKNSIIIQYAKQHSIPIYMIINGILNTTYYLDGIYADYINCYSESIKKNIFKNSNKAHVLGDPRLDNIQILSSSPEIISEEEIFIGIGASGYNNTDVGSYTAIEFDFMFDIISTIKKITNKKIKILIKTRPNNYIQQYEKFIEEYFNDQDILIHENNDFKEFISKCNIYITFYSQTIFEASLLKIPCIYYNPQEEFRNEPFDFNSKLISASNVNQLQYHLNSLLENIDYCNDFMNKNLIEYFIGPIDNKNLVRNINFINKILNEKNN